LFGGTGRPMEYYEEARGGETGCEDKREGVNRGKEDVEFQWGKTTSSWGVKIRHAKGGKWETSFKST